MPPGFALRLPGSSQACGQVGAVIQQPFTNWVGTSQDYTQSGNEAIKNNSHHNKCKKIMLILMQPIIPRQVVPSMKRQGRRKR